MLPHCSARNCKCNRHHYRHQRHAVVPFFTGTPSAVSQPGPHFPLAAGESLADEVCEWVRVRNMPKRLDQQSGPRVIVWTVARKKSRTRTVRRAVTVVTAASM